MEKKRGDTGDHFLRAGLAIGAFLLIGLVEGFSCRFFLCCGLAGFVCEPCGRAPGGPAPRFSWTVRRRSLGVESGALDRSRGYPGLDHDGLRLGRVDLNAALEVGTILDADPCRGNVTDDRAVRLDVDAVARMDIADHFAVNDHFAGVNLGIEQGGGTYG